MKTDSHAETTDGYCNLLFVSPTDRSISSICDVCTVSVIHTGYVFYALAVLVVTDTEGARDGRGKGTKWTPPPPKKKEQNINRLNSVQFAHQIFFLASVKLSARKYNGWYSVIGYSVTAALKGSRGSTFGADVRQYCGNVH